MSSSIDMGLDEIIRKKKKFTPGKIIKNKPSQRPIPAKRPVRISNKVC